MNRLISADRPIGRLAIVEAKEALVAIRWIDEGDSESTPLLVDACRQLEIKRAQLLLEAAAAPWL